MSKAVHDWKVVVGWDATAVTEGHKRISQLMSKLEKMDISASRAAVQGQKKQVNAVKEKEALERKRLQTLDRISKLERIKGTSDVAQQLRSQMAAAKTVEDFNKVILRTQEQIITAREREWRLSQANAATKKAEAEAAKRSREEARAAEMAARRAARGPMIAGPYSAVSFVPRSTVSNRQLDIDRVQEGLRVTLSKLPMDDKFALQRKEAERLIDTLGKLKEKYDKVGTRRSFGDLSTEYKRLTQDARSLTQSINLSAKAMNAQQFAADRLKASLKNLASSYVSVFAALEGGRRFMETGIEFESLDAMMLGVSGSAKQAAEDFQFVSNEVMRLGGNLLESTRSYAKFGTAASLSDFDDSAIRNMFTQISEVNRAFNLAPQRQGLVFLAFEQMLGGTAKILRPLPPRTVMCVETLV